MLVSKYYLMNYLRRKKKVIFVLIMYFGIYNNKIRCNTYTYMHIVHPVNMESERVFLCVIYVSHKHNS